MGRHIPPSKMLRAGPLPDHIYRCLVEYFRSGRIPPKSVVSDWDSSLSKLEGIRCLAAKMRACGNQLVCLATGLLMVSRENFEAAVIKIHTRDGMVGPAHRGLLATCRKVRRTYSIGEAYFGIAEAEIRRIVLRCPDEYCTYILYRQRRITGQWGDIRPLNVTDDGEVSDQRLRSLGVIDLTKDHDQNTPLDLSQEATLSIKQTAANTQKFQLTTIDAANKMPETQQPTIYMSEPMGGGVEEKLHRTQTISNVSREEQTPRSIGESIGTVGAIKSGQKRERKRDLPENPLKNIENSWLNAVQLVNSSLDPMRDTLNSNASQDRNINISREMPVNDGLTEAIDAPTDQQLECPTVKKKKRIIVCVDKNTGRFKIKQGDIWWPPHITAKSATPNLGSVQTQNPPVVADSTLPRYLTVRNANLASYTTTSTQSSCSANARIYFPVHQARKGDSISQPTIPGLSQIPDSLSTALHTPTRNCTHGGRDPKYTLMRDGRVLVCSLQKILTSANDPGFPVGAEVGDKAETSPTLAPSPPQRNVPINTLSNGDKAVLERTEPPQCSTSHASVQDVTPETFMDTDEPTSLCGTTPEQHNEVIVIDSSPEGIPGVSKVISDSPELNPWSKKVISSRAEMISSSKVNFDTPEVNSDRLKEKLDRHEVSPVSPGIIFDSPEVISDSPQMKSDRLKEMFDRLEECPGMLFESPEVISDKPDVLFDSPGVIFDSPEVISDSPQVKSNRLKEMLDRLEECPGMLFESPEVISNKPDVLSDSPGVISDSPEIIPDRPDVLSDSPGVISDSPEVIADKPDVLIDSPGVICDSPEENFGDTKEISLIQKEYVELSYLLKLAKQDLAETENKDNDTQVLSQDSEVAAIVKGRPILKSSALFQLLHPKVNSPPKAGHAQRCFANLIDIIRTMKREILIAMTNEDALHRLRGNIETAIDVIKDAKRAFPGTT